MKGKFRFREDYTYRMPVHFQGYPYDAENRVVYSDVFMLQAEQQTDLDALAQYVPSEFEILRPFVLWSYANCRGVDFMANGEYRIFQASVPVAYCDGREKIRGAYPLIIWEDDPVPILGGREEDGMPKVYCNISPERHYENHWFVSASLYCETLARFDFRESGELDAQALRGVRENPLVNNFGYRYIPLVGQGGAATCGPILYPQETHVQKAWVGAASVQLLPPDPWYKNPSMHSTLAALSGLPCLGFSNAMRAQGQLRLCVADSRAL